MKTIVIGINKKNRNQIQLVAFEMLRKKFISTKNIRAS
jgi:hypothetical protein